MIISGPLNRDIVETDYLSFNAFVTKNNTTGLFTFGFSGHNNLSITFQSGVIRGNNQEKIFNYNTNEEVNISGQIGPNSYDVFINNQPIILGQSRPTGQFYKTYVNCLNATVNYDVFLTTPPLSVNYTTQIPYISGQSGLQGNITCNKRFVIMSGTEPTLNEPFSFSGYTTGLATQQTFYINKTLNNFIDYEMPISLSTSFGQVDFICTITGIPPSQNYYSASFSPNNFSMGSGSITYNYQVLSNTGYALRVSLHYISGQPSNILDSWRLETGINQYNMSTYYPNFTGVSGLSYVKPLVTLPSNLTNINIVVSHVGTGTNISKLMISGTDFREYNITGVN